MYNAAQMELWNEAAKVFLVCVCEVTEIHLFNLM